MIEIQNIEDSRVSMFLRMRKQIDEQTFVCDGTKVVLKALESGLEVLSIFARPQFFKVHGHSVLLPENPPQCFYADDEIMEKIVGHKLHQGVMAWVKRPTDIKVDRMQGPIVALDGITNAENVGGIIRAMSCFGFKNLLCSPACPDPYLRRSVRVSMGGVFETHVCRSKDLKADLLRLGSRGFQLLGTHVKEGSVSIRNHDFGPSSVLIIGSEGNGVSGEILEICENTLHIPISAQMNSLNAIAAASIFLYEFECHKNLSN
jgi:tRNA G18 (ribose-2'-O)-methylase SpoU